VLGYCYFVAPSIPSKGFERQQAYRLLDLTQLTIVFNLEGRIPLSIRAVLLLSLFCAVAASAAHAETVGEARTVKNNVTGKLGAAERKINVGDGLSSNEQVRTAIESATQVRFIDDTTLTVGPSSSVVLDRFVVNPNRTTKDAVIEMTTGTMRFVAGRSDPKNFTIKTKTFTLGIRG
jgi:FecR protein